MTQRCYRLNAHLMAKARGGNECQYLASPVTGTGVPVARFQQLFLLARSNGKKLPQEWAAFVCDILQTNREQLLKDGRVLTTPAEVLAEVVRQANEFAQQRIVILEALQAQQALQVQQVQ